MVRLLPCSLVGRQSVGIPFSQSPPPWKKWTRPTAPTEHTGRGSYEPFTKLFFFGQPSISKCLSSAFLFKDILFNIYSWLIHTELTANKSLLGFLNKGSPAPAIPSVSHFTASQHLKATGSTWALCLEVILKSQFLTSSQKSEKCSIKQSAKKKQTKKNKPCLQCDGWKEAERHCSDLG